MIRYLPLRTRFLGAVITLLLLVGSVLVIYIHTSLKASLALQVQKRGIAIAHSVARMATNPTLTEDYIGLQLLAYDFLKGEEDIEYLFIADRHGQVIAHTFGTFFPAALSSANQLKTGERQQIMLLEVNHGTVYDIAAPIMGGELGAVHVGLNGEVVLQGVRQTTWRATWLLLGLLAVACFGALFMATSLTKPIEALIKGVEAVGQGNLGQRIAADESDEIGHLAQAFNRMAENLEATTVSRNEVEKLNQQLEAIVAERTSQLLRTNEALSQEVADRRLVEEEVRRLNEGLEQRIGERTRQLETSNRELEAFSYSVSHDLNAPLRHIEAFSSMLLEDHRGEFDEQAVHYLGRIRAGVAKMAEMIAALLNISRVGRQEIRRQEVDFTALAQNILQQMQESEPQRIVQMTVHEGMKVQGDRTLLAIVLQNLLENAWKYTANREQGNIEFGTMSTDEGPVYFVKDNGIGFDMTHSENLFGVFRRLVSESEFPGTGIGLATVQRIIARHGGKIWAKGVPDEGATFFFTV